MYSDNIENNVYQNHHVVKRDRIISSHRLFSEEIYSALISNIINKLISNAYFGKLFENATLDWCKMYLLIHLIITDSTFHFLQHKILNKDRFSTKSYTFGITNTALCSLSETPIHVFYECIFIKFFG